MATVPAECVLLTDLLPTAKTWFKCHSVVLPRNRASEWVQKTKDRVRRGLMVASRALSRNADR